MGTTGAPGAIRTPDPLVRSQILYPTELQVRSLAEKEGFEPSIQVLPVCTLSRGVPSTTRPFLRSEGAILRNAAPAVKHCNVGIKLLDPARMPYAGRVPPVPNIFHQAKQRL